MNALATTYTYDPLNRLTYVAYDNGTVIGYTYDAAGNITRIAKVGTASDPISGACGSSNGDTFTIAPDSNLCAAGTASALTGSGPWSWSCTGLNGGSTANCLARATQSIAFSVPGSRTYGDSAVNLSATGGASGNPVTFSIASGPGTLSGSNNSILTLTGAGAIVIKASQAGNSSFAAAPDATANVTVLPKPLTVRADNAVRVYGAPNPTAPGFSATGLVGTDSIGSVAYSYAATATAAAAVGSSHSITPSTAAFATGSASNYSITYEAATLTILDGAAPTITAFAVPANSNSLTIPISTFTVSDPLAVSAYLITESQTAPALNDAGWNAAVPTVYDRFTSPGTKTLYAWVKNSAGVVSQSASATVTITLTAGQNPKSVLVSSENGQHPLVVRTGDAVHVLNADADSYLKLYSSYDGGATFNSGVNISGTSQVTNGSEFSMCLDQSGNIFVFWRDSSTRAFNYLTVSASNGNILKSQAAMNYGFNWVSQADSLVDSANNVYLLFRAYNGTAVELYYVKSTNSGQSFSSPVRVTTNSVQEDYPRLAVHNGAMYVVFNDMYSSANVLLTKSSDGTTFSAPTMVNQVTGTTDFVSDIAVTDSGTLLVPYKDVSSDAGDLVIARSTNGGSSFSYTHPSSSDAESQSLPHILTSGNNVYVAWVDHRGSNYQIYIARSTDGGLSYEQDINVSNSAQDQFIRDLFLENNSLHITTVDTTTSPYRTYLYTYSFNDVSLPSVTAFTVPATVNSLNVPIDALTASDNVGISGYCLTETNSSSGCSWSTTAPTSYQFSSAGSKDLFAWVKDTSGNVSLPVPATVLVSLPVPGVCGSNNGQILAATSPDALCSSGSASAVTGAGHPWNWTCYGLNGGADSSCSASVQGYSFTAIQTGSGTGSVNSTPPGISCTSGICQESFDAGTVVTLMPTPGSTSIFFGWSGECSNLTGACTVSMDDNKFAIATFTAAPKAQIGGSGFSSLSEAYASAVDGADILLLDAQLSESPILNRAVSVRLKGGHYADFSGRSGQPTRLQGRLTIRAGKVTVDRVKVK